MRSAYDVDARYRLLARALAARPLRVATGKAGQATCTDGQTVFVRPEASEAELRIELCVQCALIRHGSINRAAAIALAGRPGRAGRYLALEMARIHRLADPLLRMVVADRLDLPTPLSRSSRDSLRLAADKSLHFAIDARLGVFRPGRILAAGPGAEHGQARAEELRRPPASSGEDQPELGEDEEADDVPRFFDKFASPLRLPFNPLRTLFESIMGARRSRSDGAPGAEIPSGGMRSAASARTGGLRAHYHVELDQASGATLLGRWRYPEWDFDKRRYRPDWCSVQEIPSAWAMDRGEPLKLRRDVSTEKRMRQLNLAMARLSRQDDGDEIDLNALIDLEVNRRSARAGCRADTGRARIYRALRRTNRDLGVLVLNDVSGSSAEKEARSRSVRAVQAQAALTVGSALSLAGDRVALLSFHSSGRDQVRAVCVKGFDDRWTRTAETFVATQLPSGFTRLGAALRHGTHRLVHDSGMPRRLLVVISDAFPYDIDYEGRYAREDVMAAMAETRAQGVALLWICCGDMHADLAAALRQHGHVLLTDAAPGALRKQLLPAVVEALAAGRQRGRRGALR